MLDPMPEMQFGAETPLSPSRRRHPKTPVNASPLDRMHPTLAAIARKTRRETPRVRRAAAGLLGAWLAAGLSAALAQSPLGADAAADLPADPECLMITQSSAATYMIINALCPDQSVLASIELSAGATEGARCFTKKIRTQISIASEAAAPVINYQCIEGATGCSVEALHGMFPECHAG